jgi:nucleoside phosphorylase
LVHFLHAQRSTWAGPNGQKKRSLLLADYAYKSRGLPPSDQARLDRQVVESLLPAQVARFPEPDDMRPEDFVDIAVLAVLSEELNATLAAFNIGEDEFVAPFGSQRFYRTHLPTRYRPDPLSVVITASGEPLNVHIGRAVEDLLRHCTPRAMFLLGIAAGVAGKVALGDVIVSKRVFYYSSARRTPDKLQPRPQHAQGSDAYGYGIFYYNPERTRYSRSVTEFITGLRPRERPEDLQDDFCPHVFTNNVTIAAGEEVLRDGIFLPELRDRFDDTIYAADQESYGFARAVRELPWLVFRGISDFGDPVQQDRWKYAASGFAAICLADFLGSQYLPPGSEVF